MNPILDLTSFKALSLDCYGTLIDWEAGIGAVLMDWAAEQGLTLTTEARSCCSPTPTTRRRSSGRLPPRSTPMSLPRRSAGPAPSSVGPSVTPGLPDSVARSRTGRRSPTLLTLWPVSLSTTS